MNAKSQDQTFKDIFRETVLGNGRDAGRATASSGPVRVAQVWRSRRMRLEATIAAVVLVAAACGGNKSPSSSDPSINSSISASLNTYKVNPPGTKVAGGTVTWAEAPNNVPTYIFPMDSATFSTTANIGYLQFMLYRPLFWYGSNNSPTIDYTRSIGNEPVWSNNNQTVTITLKDYKWSDGETVTSRDVLFWMNLYKSDPANNFSGYVAPVQGEKFFPDNVKSMSTPNSSTIVFNLTQSYNPTWFDYNELSQITPLPLAWDRTSLSQKAPTTDTGNLPDTTPSGALAVYKFLDAQSKATGSWVSSPLWSVVDGPWRLDGYSATGEVTLLPNPDYSGTPKPTISKFVELPFTDNNAELTALKTKSLTIGYLPPEDAAQQSSIESEGYALQSAFLFGTNYYIFNMNNTTLGPVFRQLYFRQAFQHLQDQQGWITAYMHGWAVPTTGPVPLEPPNSFASSLAKTNLYPFSIADASKLLSSHGWKVVPGGVSTCVKPGTGPSECGAGVAAGTKLAFNLDYVSGTASLASSMQALRASASQIGIQLDLTSHTFDTVVGTAFTPCPSASKCSWSMENWADGVGWIYYPGTYPTGEEFLLAGAADNAEGYNDPTAAKLILATTTASAADSQAALDAYQNYIIQQVPVVFTPTPVGNPVAGGPALISSKLGGVTPNAYGAFTPEDYYFSS